MLIVMGIICLIAVSMVIGIRIGERIERRKPWAFKFNSGEYYGGGETCSCLKMPEMPAIPEKFGCVGAYSYPPIDPNPNPSPEEQKQA